MGYNQAVNPFFLATKLVKVLLTFSDSESAVTLLVSPVVTISRKRERLHQFNSDSGYVRLMMTLAVSKRLFGYALPSSEIS